MLILCQGKSHSDFTGLHEIKTKKTFCNILFYKFPPNNEYFTMYLPTNVLSKLNILY